MYLYETVLGWAQENHMVIYSRLWLIMDVIQDRLGGFYLLLSISSPGAAKLNNKFTPTV